jgi:hypothetical protein
MNVTQIIIGALATNFGVYYAILGIAAIKYLRDATEVDKVVGWTLWWCLDADRYAEEGRRLCSRGILVALASIVLWIAVFAIKW